MHIHQPRSSKINKGRPQNRDSLTYNTTYTGGHIHFSIIFSDHKLHTGMEFIEAEICNANIHKQVRNRSVRRAEKQYPGIFSILTYSSIRIPSTSSIKILTNPEQQPCSLNDKDKLIRRSVQVENPCTCRRKIRRQRHQKIHRGRWRRESKLLFIAINWQTFTKLRVS